MDTLRSYLRNTDKTLDWLAKAVGRSRHSVKKWKRVPAELVIAIEAATENAVTRYDMRPDLYPRPGKAVRP